MLGNAQIHIGTETIGIHHPTHTRYAQCIDFKAYNGFTEPGLLDGLLYEHYDSIITQSFSMTDRADGERLLKRQQRHLANADDGSATQIAQIDQAIDELIDGQFVIGEYHYTMMIYADTIEALRANTRSAMSIIEEQGFLASLTTTALDAAWYAQLPGNWFYRPRIAHLTSRNFAGLASLHNFPEGKAHQNPWGDAVTIFKTPAGQPFYFNFHHSSPHTNDRGKHLLGNTRIIGQSGAGKTVLMNTLFIQAQKYQRAQARRLRQNQEQTHTKTDTSGPTADNTDENTQHFSTVFFDKDEGARLCILAAGGRYLSFTNGQPTGLNPLQLPPTNANRLFLKSLIRHLVTRNQQPITTADEQRIAQAIATVMRLPRALRRLSTLLQNLTESSHGNERDHSLIKRLAPWCADDGHGQCGSLAWVLDNEHDELDFNAVANTGIDGTHFLDNEEIRTPITLYLLHRMRDVMDGRRFIYWMDEAWKWLDDPAFEAFAGDGQATIRKKNGLGVFATQSPRTVLDSAIAPQLIEQVATEIFLPNPRASAQDYVNGFGLSHSEYQLIRELPEHSHRFLIRQQNRSVIAWLDLRGFDDELAILSGSTANNALATQIISELGNDPALWLPEFHRRRHRESQV